MWRTRWENGAPCFTRSDDFPYCHATYETFLRVMSDFRELFLRQANFEGVRLWVREHIDQVMCLGIPSNWFVHVRPGGYMPELRDQLLDDITCCRERMAVIGKCIMWVRDRFVETELILCMAADTKMYIYEPSQDILIMVAEHLDELARYGLLHAECVYRQFHTPYATRVPQDVVMDLLRNADDADTLAQCVGAYHDRDVNLHTPGRHAETLKLLANFGCLSELWPFEAIDPYHLTECQMYLSLRLRCRWYIMGAVGAYRPGGFFEVSSVVFFDRFGRIYAVIVKPYTDRTSHVCLAPGNVYRLADHLSEFFKGGLIKLYVRRRHEHHLRQLARLERGVRCIHLDETYRLHFTAFDHGVSRDFARQYRWLCRPDRFRADMFTTWDGWDAFTIWHARVLRGDFVERRRRHENRDEGAPPPRRRALFNPADLPPPPPPPPPSPPPAERDPTPPPGAPGAPEAPSAPEAPGAPALQEPAQPAPAPSPPAMPAPPNPAFQAPPPPPIPRMEENFDDVNEDDIEVLGRDNDAFEMDEDDDDDDWEDLGFDLEEDSTYDFKDLDEWHAERQAAQANRWRLGQRLMNAYHTENDISEPEVEARRVNLNRDLSPDWIHSFDFRSFFQ
ncbi:protein US23 [Cercopithecine betaherpesvirus 5]|uniref:Protein US23 n=1 Tax=Simian cytomegalovirus (strain Colburn) TaxID=50292 RepID=G8XU63_SCMVC|nr:protein US23 [Cercopithecine betaherpesvirus 5]